MVEPEKPFACTIPDCGMTFTNEDHLHVHTKKHDMVLQLGLEQKAAFVADQTPTPTRFIRNCEEVGLFQDLQNVNPFEEGFKRAMETKHNLLSLENTITTTCTTDELHTPQMFPLLDPGDTTLYSTTNNQRNITISRSSSDESGVIKEFETTTISKQTNEVTTISRVVEKHDDPKAEEFLRDGIRKDCISYNSATKVQTEMKTEHMQKNSIQTLIYEDTIVKNNISKDLLLSDPNKLQLPDIPPIMSQKSLEYVVESLTNDLCKDDSRKSDDDKNDNYEVIIKLPNGRQVRMRSIEENERRSSAKEKLKEVLKEKDKTVPPKVCLLNNNSVPVVSNLVPITTGTLIPVTLVSPPTPVVPKIPIAPLKSTKVLKKPVKRRHLISERGLKEGVGAAEKCNVNGFDANSNKNKRFSEMESKCAASRRYRARLKESWVQQAQENQQLKEENEKLLAERAMLKMLIIQHMKKCPDADDFRSLHDKLQSDHPE